MIVQSKTLLDVVGPTEWHLESWGLTYSVWLPTATGYLSAPPTKVAFHRVFPVTIVFPLPGCFAVRTQQRRSCSALQLARAHTVVVVL